MTIWLCRQDVINWKSMIERDRRIDLWRISWKNQAKVVRLECSQGKQKSTCNSRLAQVQEARPTEMKFHSIIMTLKMAALKGAIRRICPLRLSRQCAKSQISKWLCQVLTTNRQIYKEESKWVQIKEQLICDAKWSCSRSREIIELSTTSLMLSK